MTYADDPAAHLKTEFGFDVLQVARGHYPPKAYHDFIGFQVSKDLLDRAFQKTYGLKLKEIFPILDLSLGTYRYAVSTMIPNVTVAAWKLKKKEILKDQPTLAANDSSTTSASGLHQRMGHTVRASAPGREDHHRNGPPPPSDRTLQ